MGDQEKAEQKEILNEDNILHPFDAKPAHAVQALPQQQYTGIEISKY